MLKWQFLIISFGEILRSVLCTCPGCYGNGHLDGKNHLQFRFHDYYHSCELNILHKMYIEFFWRWQIYLVKIVLFMHNKCPPADIVHNYVNRSKVEQRTRTNLAHSNRRLNALIQYLIESDIFCKHLTLYFS